MECFHSLQLANNTSIYNRRFVFSKLLHVHVYVWYRTSQLLSINIVMVISRIIIAVV